jgi:hypothetical protein
MNGRLLDVLGRTLSVVLIVLGVVITASTLAQVGVDRLVLGHIFGPGLVAAGIARLKLQRLLGGGDGDAA